MFVICRRLEGDSYVYRRLEGDSYVPHLSFVEDLREIATFLICRRLEGYR